MNRPLLALLLVALLPALPAFASPGGSSPATSPLRWAAPQLGGRTAAQGEKKPTAKAAQALVPAGGVCKSDEECEAGSYCDYGRCKIVERPFNALYLYYRSGDRRFTEILGIYWHQKGESGYRVLFPIFWHFWDKQVDNLVVFPVQVRRTPTEKNYRFWPLFFWTDYGERGSGITVMPLFHRAREGTRTATFIPLFLSGYNIDPPRRRSQGLVLGLFYWKTDGVSGYRARALFPFFYRSSDPERSFTWTLPLNFFTRERDERTALIVPLYFHGSSPNRARTFGLLPPFYYQRTGDTRWLHVFPLYYSRSSPARGYNVLFPLYWGFRSRGRSLHVAGPAFYYSNRRTGHRLGMVFPLLYYRSRQHGLLTRIVSPLFLYEKDVDAGVKHWGLVVPPYYSRRDTDREVDALIPLAMRWHDKNERSTTWVLGPLILNSDPEGGSQIAFPIFWRFKDQKTGAATSVLFPLAYRIRRPDGSHFNLFFPFFYGRRGEARRGGVFPLLFLGSSPERRHAVLFPLFWHLKSKQRATTILGPLFYRTERGPRGGWQAGLAPVLFAGNQGGEQHHVLFPVLWHLKSFRHGYRTLVAGPAFYSRGRKGRVFGLLPLFAAGTWRGRSFQTVLGPVLYHSATVDKDPARFESTTLFTLYYGWEDPKERGHSFFPLFYHRRLKAPGAGQTTAFLPFFYFRARGSERLLVTPLGGVRRGPPTATGSGTVEGLLGPFAFHRSDETRGFALVPILYHWQRLKQRSRTTVLLPFGVHHASPERRALVWFPLLWRFSDARERSLVVFPILWQLRQQGGLDADVAFPVFWSLRSPRRRTLVVGPFFHTRAGAHVNAGLVPLGFYRRDAERSTLVTLPFIYRRRDFARDERQWVVGPFYRWSYPDGASTGVLPLFFHKRRPDSHYTLLLPLLWHFAEPPARKRLTFVGPFFYRRNGDERSFGLAPLLYGAWDRVGGRSAALFPLFYLRREVARFGLYTPIAGGDVSPERRLFYVLPYFRRRSTESALDILAPLFVRHRDHAAGRTTVFSLPGYFGRWSPERSLHIAFPFVWRVRRIDESATVVFPFLWDFNDRFASRTTVVFPVFLRHRDHQEGTSSFVVPPLWVRQRKEATDAVLFPLVWRFGGKRSSTTVAAPLFYDVKRPGSRTTLLVPFFLRLDRPTERRYYVLPNTFYRKSKKDGLYRFMFIPLVDVHRKRVGDIHVETLFGIVGYERVGKNRFLTLFYYTFPLEPTGPKTLSGLGGARPASVFTNPIW